MSGSSIASKQLSMLCICFLISAILVSMSNSEDLAMGAYCFLGVCIFVYHNIRLYAISVADYDKKYTIVYCILKRIMI